MKFVNSTINFLIIFSLAIGIGELCEKLVQLFFEDFYSYKYYIAVVFSAIYIIRKKNRSTLIRF